MFSPKGCCDVLHSKGVVTTHVLHLADDKNSEKSLEEVQKLMHACMILYVTQIPGHPSPLNPS